MTDRQNSKEPGRVARAPRLLQKHDDADRSRPPAAAQARRLRVIRNDVLERVLAARVASVAAYNNAAVFMTWSARGRLDLASLELRRAQAAWLALGPRPAVVARWARFGIREAAS